MLGAIGLFSLKINQIIASNANGNEIFKSRFAHESPDSLYAPNNRNRRESPDNLYGPHNRNTVVSQYPGHF
jgi:hypothetical protein